MSREVAERLRKMRKVEEVVTDEGKFYVRGLSGTERGEYVAKFMADDMTITDRLLGDQHIVAAALCDKAGAPIYDSFDDAFAAVCDWPIPLVTQAALKITEISGMAVKAVEAAAKKSEASPS